MKKVLLTGASGFVGSNLIQMNVNLELKPFSLREHNIEDIDWGNIEVVVHLAAYVHQMRKPDPKKYYEINYDLTRELADAAKKAGVKHFVFMSTTKVFGETNAMDAAWNEETRCCPGDDYGKSKLMAEEYLNKIKSDSFKVTIIRTPVVYGANVKGNIKKLVELVEKYPIVPLGGINNKRSMIYVKNLVDFVFHVMNNNLYGLFVVRDQELLSTSDFLRLINNHAQNPAKVINMPGILIYILKKLKPDFYDRLCSSVIVDNGKSIKVAKFVPRFSANEGIKEMLNK